MASQSLLYSAWPWEMDNNENDQSGVGCERMIKDSPIYFAMLVNILSNLCKNCDQTLFFNAFTFARSSRCFNLGFRPRFLLLPRDLANNNTWENMFGPYKRSSQQDTISMLKYCHIFCVIILEWSIIRGI